MLPRPTVDVRMVQREPGVYTVIVSASSSVARPANPISLIAFGPARNATIEMTQSQTRATSRGNQSFAVAPASETVTFVVRRDAAGADIMVPFTVHDGCGPWQTFVGTGRQTP